MTYIASLRAQVFYDQGKQISGSDSIVYGNSNALSANPAFLGVSGKTAFDIRLLQVGFSSHSEALDKVFVNRFTFSDGQLDTTSKAELAQLVQLDELDFDMRTKATWLGFTLVSPTLGGLSVEVSDEVESNLLLGETLTELALFGLNAEWLSGKQDTMVDIPSSANGSEIYFNHYRSLKIAYGRQLLGWDGFRLYGGVQLSRLFGIGHLDLQFAEGRVVGQSSFSRFYDINYGNTATLGEELGTKLLHNAGSGWAWGFGLHLSINETLSASLSLQGLGSLTYDYETASLDAAQLQAVSNIEDGIESYEFNLETDYLYDVFGLREGSSFEYKLPGRARANLFYTPSRSFTLSGDFVFPVTGNDVRFSTPVSALVGLRYRPSIMGTRLITLSSGLFYHELFGLRLPLGVAGAFAGNSLVSISTNDIVSLLSGETNPLSSLTIMSLGLRVGI